MHYLSPTVYAYCLWCGHVVNRGQQNLGGILYVCSNCSYFPVNNNNSGKSNNNNDANNNNHYNNHISLYSTNISNMTRNQRNDPVIIEVGETNKGNHNVCAEKTLRKNPSHTETSQPIYNAN